MIRFVVGPDDTIVPDIAGRLPGRGLWIAADRGTLDRAVARNAFSRAARRTVAVPPGLTDQVILLQERACLDLLGLARRAGQVVAGFDKVETALKRRRPGVLVLASDGGADGRAKLLALAGDAPRVERFPAAALAAALGQSGVTVYAAIAPGAIAERFLTAVGRLEGVAPFFRSPDDEGLPGQR